jgi:hypothetical protein
LATGGWFIALFFARLVTTASRWYHNRQGEFRTLSKITKIYIFYLSHIFNPFSPKRPLLTTD